MKHWLLLFGLSTTLLCGCQQKMATQPKFLAYAPTSFSPDQSSARPVPSGAVSRDQLYGMQRPTKAKTILKRGEERYRIYCAVCHGPDGKGDGPVRQHGFNRLAPLPKRLIADDALYERTFLKKKIEHPFQATLSPSDRWATLYYLEAQEINR